MYKLLFAFIFILTGLSNCGKQNIAEGTPMCIKKKVANFEKESTCNDATIKEYTFQTKSVFVFESGTCGGDMTSEVYSEDCKSLGYLGGISGNVEINGEDFSNAEFVKVCWKK